MGVVAGEAFEDAFKSLLPRAFALALRISGDRQAAQDAAAEGLSRAYARWEQLGSSSYRDAWVLRVTANLAIDAARRREPALVPLSVADVADVATLRAVTTAALGSLPRRQREVVAMRYLAGLTEEEVASVLDIAKGTVKSHAHRGLQALRASLTEVEVIADGT